MQFPCFRQLEQFLTFATHQPLTLTAVSSTVSAIALEARGNDIWSWRLDARQCDRDRHQRVTPARTACESSCSSSNLALYRPIDVDLSMADPRPIRL
jgi:hypothetical protein